MNSEVSVELSSSTNLHLSVPALVHKPDKYGIFLARVLMAHACGKSAVDLTTGSGLHALTLAQAGFDVVAVDVNPVAVKAAVANAESNDLRVDARHGDLFDALAAGEQFDCLVAWPPVMPFLDAVEDDWWTQANAAGQYGRSVLDRILTGARGHMTESGCLWVLHPWYLSLEATERVCEQAGLELTVVDSETFPIGKVSRRQLPYLASIGFRPRVVKGEPVQDMSALRIEVAP